MRIQGFGLAFLFCACAAFTLASGCATSPKPSFTGPQNAPNDKALVYLYRPKRTVIGAGGWMEPYVNGKALGKLRNGNYIEYLATPGTHVVHFRYSHPSAGAFPVWAAPPEGASSDGSKAEFTFDAGKVYYVAYPSQKLVDAEKGRQELSQCDVVKP